MRFRDSSLRPVELLVRNRLDHLAVGAVVVVVRDISERKAREERLRQDALHDPLTALPNRTLFADRLAHALQRQRRSSGSVAVLFVDIDEFKSVNDRLGHRAGDQLMIAIARRLSSSLRASDTAARLGGDEFGVLIEGADQADACELADRILKAFNPPFVIDGHSFDMTASIGIATSIHPTDTGSELLRRADLAMYAAKMSDRSGRLRGVPSSNRGCPSRGTGFDHQPSRSTRSTSCGSTGLSASERDPRASGGRRGSADRLPANHRAANRSRGGLRGSLQVPHVVARAGRRLRPGASLRARIVPGGDRDRDSAPRDRSAARHLHLAQRQPDGADVQGARSLASQPLSTRS